MPIATADVYHEMLDRAQVGGFAYPAINVVSSQSLNAAIRGFEEAGSDGIIQVSVGGAAHWSGSTKGDMVGGALAMAAFAHEVCRRSSVTIGLHTDHCPPDKLDTFMRPLVRISQARVAAGEEPLFQSHMWDGSAVSLEKNLSIAVALLDECAQARTVMELEVGVVGGEEDGVSNERNEKLYSDPDDFVKTVEALGTGERGEYLLAATFGNVHGVYKPGNVVLRPSVLHQGQQAVRERFGTAQATKSLKLVFHGGSGSSLEEIRETLDYGVVKMNIDTDTQYAFTRAIADHMFRHYDEVLKIDGELGRKQMYDPRAWGAAAEEGMGRRVAEACDALGSAGNSMSA